MGGLYGLNPTSSVLIYDIATDTWAAGPELAVPMDGGCAAVHGGKIHLAGGTRGFWTHGNTGWEEAASGPRTKNSTCGSILLG